MNISVIICAHNPRTDYLRRTLDALKAQTLPKQEWELLLIDNASMEPLVRNWDLSWHPNSRHVLEQELGLTPARLCGIREAKTEVFVFVDDDCELDTNYLLQALEISERHPLLGAWGGQCIPGFETVPEEWTKPFWGFLTIRKFEKQRWANCPTVEDCVPWGAGLCIRSNVAKVYAERVKNDSILKGLDRRGKTGPIFSCGDMDMALTSWNMSLGVGIFPILVLKHLIPQSRVQEEYLLKVVEGHAYSYWIMAARRGERINGKILGRVRRILGLMKRRIILPRRERLFAEAKLNGQQNALRDIKRFGLTQ